MRLLKASVGVVRSRAHRWRVSRSCGERVSRDFGRPLLATTRIIVRISGPRVRLATKLATVLDRGAIKNGGPEADFVFENGADGRIRTGDPLFTKQLLCQLSYVGVRPDYMKPAERGLADR